MKNTALTLITALLLSLPAEAARETPHVELLSVHDIISPASADFIHRGLEKAAEDKANAVVLELDTPGGLMDSMKAIVQDILASPVPVITYVSPSGAHSASAGVYIMYASHIAAMAPGTNLGAATPITLDKPEAKPTSVLEKKMSSDAAAYLRSLAEIRKRNAEWGEKAVYDSVSLSASEAEAQHVVDATAASLPELLDRVDGRSVKMKNGAVTLKTKNAAVERIEPDWRARLLSIVTNPNITFLLMTIGAYGIILEFSHPGAFFPGIMGAICLLLGMYALNILPVSYTGLSLILLGLGCMAAEAFMPSFGVLGIGGAAAFAIGALMLFDPSSGIAVSPPLVASVTLLSLAFFGLLLAYAVKARRRPVTTGAEALKGAEGTIMEWSQTAGTALVAGAVWKAQSSTAYILKKGDKIEVLKVEGLSLVIRPLRHS